MKAGGEILTPPAMEKIVVEQQEKIAAETGCAFFNTPFTRGDGRSRGTMGRWYEGEAATGERRFHASPARRGSDCGRPLRKRALVRSYDDASRGTPCTPQNETLHSCHRDLYMRERGDTDGSSDTRENNEAEHETNHAEIDEACRKADVQTDTYNEQECGSARSGDFGGSARGGA